MDCCVHAHLERARDTANLNLPEKNDAFYALSNCVGDLNLLPLMQVGHATVKAITRRLSRHLGLLYMIALMALECY